MSCSKKRKGNLFDSNLSNDGPFTGTIEQECKNDGKYSKQSVSYSTNVKPENPSAVVDTLEEQFSKSGKGLLGNVASVFKSVFGPPSKVQKHVVADDNENSNEEETPVLPIEDQHWPEPQFEEGAGHLFPHDENDKLQDGGKSKKRRASVRKPKKTTNSKKQVKSLRKKSIPKRSKKKSQSKKKSTSKSLKTATKTTKEKKTKN